MRSRRTKTHLEELARKYNIKVSQMEEIAEAPFRFFVQIASEGDREQMNFDSVRIMGFGLFSVKEGRKQHFKKINNAAEHIKS
jgi:hypothetical protein